MTTPIKAAPTKAIPAAAPSFEEFCTMYPRLRTLRREAAAIKDDPDAKSFCANDRWYGHSQPRRASLRNRVAEIANLAGHKYTFRSYDLIYETIYNELPDCRNCGCMWREEAA